LTIIILMLFFLKNLFKLLILMKSLVVGRLKKRHTPDPSQEGKYSGHLSKPTFLLLYYHQTCFAFTACLLFDWKGRPLGFPS